MWRFTWAGGGAASFTVNGNSVVVDYINRGAASAGRAGDMLAAALRSAGVAQPTVLHVPQVLQKAANSTAVLEGTLRNTAAAFGGTVQSIQQGVDATGTGRIRA